jgi:hypothetical protein
MRRFPLTPTLSRREREKSLWLLAATPLPFSLREKGRG